MWLLTKLDLSLGYSPKWVEDFRISLHHETYIKTPNQHYNLGNQAWYKAGAHTVNATV